MKRSRKICVIGLGYIGLPTASLLATKGFKVVGVDVNEEAVRLINDGKIHIVEPDLDILVKSAVNSGNLSASLKPEEADFFIIAVPTPFKDGHQPDLSYVEAATEAIIPYLSEGNLVVLESTSPVGTTDMIHSRILKARKELEGRIFSAHCPERVLPGHILRELVDNDRIIGGVDKASTEKAVELYSSFVNGSIFPTNAKTAELTKLVENSYRDVNIAFANELSMICYDLDINVWEVIEFANKHPRVNILKPGPGVGGHCIAVDPWFVVHASPGLSRLIKTAREVNDSKPVHVIHRIKEKAARFKEPCIACLGLSYKANIDDLRESPAVEIVERLSDEKVGRLLVVEPHIEALPKALLKRENVELTDFASAFSKADIIALLVDHTDFFKADREKLKEKVVIDTRGIWA
ncbi:MAG: UDP-N-acetyl-D-mannosamine dehydrogenase [Deltaproteobacteria bacterium]|nr:UDP-N-acetyl-D-mannosamine dehydrogenase [Deltaproteobacteria bacterium]